jgi:hypothetical protein
VGSYPRFRRSGWSHIRVGEQKGTSKYHRGIAVGLVQLGPIRSIWLIIWSIFWCTSILANCVDLLRCSPACANVVAKGLR